MPLRTVSAWFDLELFRQPFRAARIASMNARRPTRQRFIDRESESLTKSYPKRNVAGRICPGHLLICERTKRDNRSRVDSVVMEQRRDRLAVRPLHRVGMNPEQRIFGFCKVFYGFYACCPVFPRLVRCHNTDQKPTVFNLKLLP